MRRTDLLHWGSKLEVLFFLKLFYVCISKKNRRWTKLLLQVSSFVVLLFLAQLQRLLRKQLLKLSSIVNGAGYFPKRFVSWSFSAPHSSPHGQKIQGQTAPTAFFTHLISLHIKPQFLSFWVQFVFWLTW